MSHNPYDQFFAKAQDNTKDKVRFSVKSPGKNTNPSATKSAPKAQAKNSPDQNLRTHMKVKRRKAPFPMKAVVGLAATLALVIGYVASPETFEKLASKIQISAMGAASAEEKPADKSAEKSKSEAKAPEKAAGAGGDKTKAKGPEEKSAVNDDTNHFDKLKQRKDELDLREKELTELEEELQKQKVELDKRITQLEGMREQIAQTLKDRVEIDQEKVNKLVDLYSNMKPKQAADIIGSLNEELAVEVLAKMKKKNAAEVINLLPAEKARILSEKYTGYRRIASPTEPKG